MSMFPMVNNKYSRYAPLEPGAMPQVGIEYTVRTSQAEAITTVGSSDDNTGVSLMVLSSEISFLEN
jgi:hypothetical protein